jgi:beta-barrel assembly-enhancing protease
MINHPLLQRLAVLLCCLLPLAAAAQLPGMQNFKRPVSNGPLPVDFVTPTAEKYKNDLAKIDKSQQQSIQEAEDEFYLLTNYQVDQMRFSGEVLVNDSLGLFVNQVADSLLAHDPELRKKLHFYILRTPVVNAFATDQGVIFVTVGLLTRVRNEAELAFVLAHEIVHYKRRHVVTGYLETEKMRTGTEQYEGITLNNRFYKKHSYSRSQETQADEEGFELLLKSNYDPHAAVKGFDLLAQADFPFTDTTFSRSFFENDYFVLPSKYQPDTIKPFKIDEEDGDNDLATHPSVGKRRRGMARKFRNTADTTGSYFLVSEKQFYRVRMMARFEECALHTDEGNYKDAIYMTYAMLQYYPGNPYLEKEMSRALYGSVLDKNMLFDFGDFAALFQNIFIVSGGDFSEDKPTGEIGRFKRVAGKTQSEAWNVLALQYVWNVYAKYPNDSDIKTWTTALFREMTFFHEMKQDDFQSNDSLFLKLGDLAAADSTLKKKVKSTSARDRFQLAVDSYDIDSIYTDVHYWSFTFIDELKDPKFISMFKSATQYADSVKQVNEMLDQMSSAESRRYRRRRKSELLGTQGIRRIVLIDPQYAVYDQRNERVPLDINATLEGREQFVYELKRSAGLCNVELTLLDQTVLDTTSAAAFNDLNTANRWLAVRDDVRASKLMPYSQADMQAMAQKYGTNYFMWTAYVVAREKRSFTVVRAISLVLLPIAPHTAYRLATRSESVSFVAIVYDVSTGKLVYSNSSEMSNQRNTKSRMRLNVYDLMRQISNPKK